RAACRSIIWEIWALSVDDREVDSVVVDEGETDELASEVRIGLSAGGGWIRTSGTADDARLLADLYAHNASRQMPQKGSSDQTVACFRRLGAGVVGSAAVCAFRFRPRERAARGPAGADRAPSSARCASNRLPAVSTIPTACRSNSGEPSSRSSSRMLARQ